MDFSGTTRPPFAEVERLRAAWRDHADVSTTMIYTHVLNRGGLGVRSPADKL